MPMPDGGLASLTIAALSAAPDAWNPRPAATASITSDAAGADVTDDNPATATIPEDG